MSKVNFFCVKKRGRYLKGMGYATGIGHKYQWTAEKSEALRWPETEATADYYASVTKAKVEVF